MFNLERTPQALDSKFSPGLWSRTPRHPTPTPTPGNFDYPTPTPDRLRPSAALVTYLK